MIIYDPQKDISIILLKNVYEQVKKQLKKKLNIK